jgi:hypothetical protein
MIVELPQKPIDPKEGIYVISHGFNFVRRDRIGPTYEMTIDDRCNVRCNIEARRLSQFIAEYYPGPQISRNFIEIEKITFPYSLTSYRVWKNFAPKAV